MSNKMDFYASYQTVDVWREFDTKSGKEKFTFWFLGQSYERDNAELAMGLARSLYDNWVKKINQKEA